MREKSKLRLNARQRQAAILLAEGHDTVSSIAKRLGVDRTTLYNWKKRPDFQALTNQIQQRGRSCQRDANEPLCRGSPCASAVAQKQERKNSLGGR